MLISYRSGTNNTRMCPADAGGNDSRERTNDLSLSFVPSSLFGADGLRFDCAFQIFPHNGPLVHLFAGPRKISSLTVVKDCMHGYF